MRYRKILADHFGGLHLDPESLIYLEAGVRRKTLRAMQTADRVKLAGVIEILEEKANIREDAALQIGRMAEGGVGFVPAGSEM